MVNTHPHYVHDFKMDEELFFEEFDRAYEKVITQVGSWEKSNQLSVAPRRLESPGAIQNLDYPADYPH